MITVRIWRWAVVGIVFIIISIPTILEMVPPNHWYGFRVSRTLSDEGIWYAANRVMGIDLLLAGLAIMISVIVTGKILQHNQRRASRICFLIVLLFLLAALAHSFWALDQM